MISGVLTVLCDFTMAQTVILEVIIHWVGNFVKTNSAEIF